jgi:hypothetical protein
MISENDFKAAMRHVVAAHLPDELEIFDFDADAMIGELYKNGDIRATAERAEFAFGADTAKSILEFVGLVCGAFTTMLGVVKLGRDTLGTPVERNRFAQLLELELLRSGMKPDKAAQIAKSTAEAVLPKATGERK